MKWSSWVAALWAIGCSATEPPAELPGPAPRAAPLVPAKGMPLDEPEGSLPDAPSLTPILLQPTPMVRYDVQQYMERLGRGCMALNAIRARASGDDPHGGVPAFDDHLETTWNARHGPPQVIAFDLSEGSVVSGLLLIPEMTPSPAMVTHVVEYTGSDQQSHGAFIVRSTMASSHLYAVMFPEPLTTRSISVRTTESPSWVAWREIVPIACER